MGQARPLPGRRGRGSPAVRTAGLPGRPRREAREKEEQFRAAPPARKPGKIRYMGILKADKDTEAGLLPDEKFLSAMGAFFEEGVKAGVILSGEGLQPSSKGARVRYSGSKRTV